MSSRRRGASELTRAASGGRQNKVRCVCNFLGGRAPVSSKCASVNASLRRGAERQTRIGRHTDQAILNSLTKIGEKLRVRSQHCVTAVRIPAGTEVSRTPGRSVPEAEPTRAGNGGARAGMCVC
eukprot:COSAG03_NODE_16442_length_401_cov_366.956954_1_plen_123_part_01